MKADERDYYQRVMNLTGHIGDYENSLEKLLIFLYRFYGERAVILIDEYDAPVHAGLKEGYYDESIEKAIEENIVLKDISNREDLLWSFLLMGGYLKQTWKRRDDISVKIYYQLSIPNKEVRATYTRIVDSYFSTKIENRKLEIMLC